MPILLICLFEKISLDNHEKETLTLHGSRFLTVTLLELQGEGLKSSLLPPAKFKMTTFKIRKNKRKQREIFAIL